MSSPNNASLQAERASLLEKPFSQNGSAKDAPSGANAKSTGPRRTIPHVPFLDVLLRALSAWPA